MGAEARVDIIKGKSAQEAFSEAVRDASYYNGSGGYTGSIAEANGYRLMREALPKGEAMRLADDLLRTDKVEKWGPAVLIPVIPTVTTRTFTIAEIDVTGMDYDARQAAALQAAAALLRTGEVVEHVTVYSHDHYADNKPRGSKTYKKEVVTRTGELVTKYVVYTRTTRTNEMVVSEHDTLAEAKAAALAWAEQNKRYGYEVHIDARKRRIDQPLISIRFKVLKETAGVEVTVGEPKRDAAICEWVAAGVYSS